MNIAIVAIGTRGDVQPILPLALGLKSAGYSVRMIAGTNFQNWIESHGFEFTGAVNVDDMVYSDDGVAWVENGQDSRKQLKYMQALADQFGGAIAQSILEGAHGADLLLTGFVSESVAQAVGEKYHIPVVRTLLQPYIPTERGTNLMIPLLNHRDSLLNRWWGHFGQRIMWTFFCYVNKYRQMWGLTPHTFQSYYNLLSQMPVLQGFSRHVVPPAPDLPAHIYTTGYWFFDNDHDWQPSQDLLHFLESSPAPVYIGFGSMPSSDPEKRARLMVEALQKSGQRGIIHTGTNISAADLPANIFVMKTAPHHWLFPQMAGVIHHGGAGTTASGLRAGVPTLIVPHMADQPYWARRVHELGVGVKPIPRHLLTADNLAEGVIELVNNVQLKHNAAELGEKIRQERGVENAVDAVGHIIQRQPQRAV